MTCYLFYFRPYLTELVVGTEKAIRQHLEGYEATKCGLLAYSAVL